MIKRMKDHMKTHTKEKLTTILFVLLVFSLMIGMLFHVKEIGGEFIVSYRMNVLPETPLLKRVSGAISAMDSSINAGVPARPQFIETYGLAQLLMNKKIVIDPNYGALYKTPYGQIVYAVEEKYLPVYLEPTYELTNTLAMQEIPLLYVQAPFKLPDAHSQVPLTVTDYSNKNVDEFLAGLTAASVSCFDLRPILSGSGMTQNQLFYNTDHHWTIDAALFATREIVKKLNADYGFEIDESNYEISQFDRKTWPNFYIGSMGRRVGRIYGGLDDFTLITPKYETNFSVTEDGAFYAEGSFEDAILKKEYIDEQATLDTNRYAVYHGDNAELIFENHMVSKGKILVIKDSFGIPVYSFLALGVHEVRAVDVRLFEEDVAEYAIKYNPDIVLLLYNADCFTDQMFDFKTK